MTTIVLISATLWLLLVMGAAAAVPVVGGLFLVPVLLGTLTAAILAVLIFDMAAPLLVGAVAVIGFALCAIGLWAAVNPAAARKTYWQMRAMLAYGRHGPDSPMQEAAYRRAVAQLRALQQPGFHVSASGRRF